MVVVGEVFMKKSDFFVEGREEEGGGGGEVSSDPVSCPLSTSLDVPQELQPELESEGRSPES